MQGLTIDNPDDSDWYRFRLDAPGASGAQIMLDSASSLDGLTLDLLRSADTPLKSGEEMRISHDRTELNGGHDTQATAYELKDAEAIRNLARIRGLSIHDASDVNFFKFALTAEGAAADRINLLKANAADDLKIELLDESGKPIVSAEPSGVLVSSIYLDGQAPGVYYLRVQSGNGKPARYELGIRVPTVQPGDTSAREYGQIALDLSGKQSSEIDLAGLNAGDYLLKVSSPRAIPTVYDLTFKLGSDTPEIRNLSTRTETVRRDVILGGAGNDVLQGGAGEDWIFGQAGNDVLTGGYDRQAEDLLLGGEGDDTFQLLPDGLPLIKGSTETFIPTFNDRFDGGEGDDRVLFQGGDLDRLGQPVPDNVAIRWNSMLHRYEFTALQWDIANQCFVADQTVVNALDFAPLSVGSPLYRQNYLFYQTIGVEHTVIDTRAGNDVVHGEPEFKYPNVDSEWGIDRATSGRMRASPCWRFTAATATTNCTAAPSATPSTAATAPISSWGAVATISLPVAPATTCWRAMPYWPPTCSNSPPSTA